ncbi:general secretion pathway protein GspK [Pseudomonas sp. Teo4]|uniref:general secretion pathway protein GspK n=1 Tax=Pseudomonas sp. Teo4 TaxID=3064528 RepID=UPI002AB92B47|nr:type II secretion system protein GspK [Pseudomonas sp. Teo4]MDZ3994216.1 Type II secretion system protein K [Pseudomonas sp. Teo4]
MRPERQRGLALVTVLLILALATMLAAGMLRSHQLLLAGASQQIQASRLMQLALSGERLALVQIGQQASELVQLSHNGQTWANARTFKLGDGQLTVRMEDLAGRFNVGSLVGLQSLDKVLLERWQRLCHSLQIKAPALDPLVGRPLIDISQLRTLPGVTSEVLARLKPWIVALPKEAGLNVNTTSARLLGTLEKVDEPTASRLLRERPAAGYANVQQFLAAPALSGQGPGTHGLAVGSRWFRLELTAQQGGQQLYVYSDVEIDAKTQRPRVVRRVVTALREPRLDE